MFPDESSPTPDGPRKNYFWPMFLGGLLGTHVLLMLLAVYIATRDRSFAVEENYYQKGLHWDDWVKQRDENARLGWTVSLDLGAAAGALGERTLACRLTNRLGTPLDGAQIDLVAFAHARASERTALVLQPQGDGSYQASLRIPRKGLWEFRLVVRRGPDTLTYTEQRRV